jgi:hypothetical protein
LFDGDKAGREGSASAVEKLAVNLYVWAPDVSDGFKFHKSAEAVFNKIVGC